MQYTKVKKFVDLPSDKAISTIDINDMTIAWLLPFDVNSVTNKETFIWEVYNHQ